MKCISEVGLRFLIGIGIAVLIGFLFWYFVIHNASDRAVEKSFQKFYYALDRACQRIATKDNPEKVYLEMPQKTFSQMLGEEIRKIFGGATKTFQDPYYTIHWEYFPPEPPYELTDVAKFGITGLPGTLASIFIPWYEDLPWSTNLLTSMAIHSLFLGFDVLGIRGAKNAISRAVHKSYATFKNKLSEIGESIAKRVKMIFSDSEIIKKIKDFLEGVEVTLEEVSVKIKDKIEKVKVTIQRIKENRVVRITAGTLKPIELSENSAQLVILCLFLTDNNLGDCIEYGILGAITLRASYSIAKEVAFPALKLKIKTLIAETIGDLKSFASNVKEEIKYKLVSLKTLIFGKKDLLEKLSEDLEKAEKYLKEIEEFLKSEEIDYNELEKKFKSLKEILSSLPEKVREIGETNPEIYEEVYASVFMKSKLMEESLDELLNFLSIKGETILHAKGVITVSELEGVLDKLPEKIIDKPNEKILISQGFGFEEVDGKEKLVLTKEKNEKLFKDFEEYSKYYKEVEGENLERIGDYRLIYDKEGNLVKVVFDPQESLGKRFKEIFIDPIKNFLKEMEAKGFIWNEIIDSETVKEFIKDLLNEIQKKPKSPFVENLEKALKMDSDKIAYKLQSLADKMENSIGIVIEKNTKLAEMMKNLPDKSPKEVSHMLREYAYYIATSGDQKEIELFKNLLNGKDMRLKEDLELFFRKGAIGYATLRVIDLYTPLGATYWDKYLSYYGYEGQKVPEGCQTQCEEGKICVQLGACFRQYELPESCKKLGIESMKIERDSLVAKNPRFYLVSPCYGEAQIYLDQNERSIFVKVLLDPNKKPNYCYAYKGYVDAYVISEATEIIARCSCGILCATLEAMGTAGLATPLAAADAVKACIGGGPIGLCSILCNLVDMSILVFREGLMVWPNVYENFPNLAEWMQ
jgi:hypothetical protein